MEEVGRALRQLKDISQRDKQTVESLSSRIVEAVMSRPKNFAEKTSKSLPNSRRLPIVCRMFGQEGPGCDPSRCVAERGIVPPEASCRKTTAVKDERGPKS